MIIIYCGEVVEDHNLWYVKAEHQYKKAQANYLNGAVNHVMRIWEHSPELYEGITQRKRIAR